jgi:flagellar hook-associated protein 1 FlgK
MREIARLNTEIQTIYESSSGAADLEDQRDRYIDQLSKLMDVQVAQGERGGVRVYTGGGNLLVDQQAATFAFDARTLMDAAAQYSMIDSERGVGTLTMVDVGGGTALDLFKHGTFNSGEIAALRELRDVTLVQAQAQLDEIAHGLALAMSQTSVPGTAVSVGAQDGFTLDVADLMAGNEISVTFTRTPGIQQTYTFVRVDDAGSLPLANDFTARANDTVVGIDFSGGIAAAAAAIDAALGAGFTVTSPGADTIRFLDDGAPGAVAINSVSALVTPSDLQGGTLGAALFVELDGSYKTYSNSPDGGGQKLGFAGRITFNQTIAADNSLLVQYDATTGTADPARPQALYDRFADTPFVFSAKSGIGGVNTPFTGSISSFVQRVINFQAQQSSNADRAQEAQTIVIDALQTRFDQDTKVNVDEELSRLLEFQNSYAANARVMSVLKELLDILMRV